MASTPTTPSEYRAGRMPTSSDQSAVNQFLVRELRKLEECIAGLVASGGTGGTGGSGSGSGSLPIASSTVLGGIKIGPDLRINSVTGVAGVNFPTNYSLPIASSSVLGGVKVGSGLAIDSGTGVLSATAGSGGGSGGGSGSDVQQIEFANTGVNFPSSLAAGSQQSFLAYQITDPTDMSDLVMLAIELKEISGIGAKFEYALYAGDPLGTGSSSLLSKGAAPITTGTGNFNVDFRSSATVYVSNADLKTGIYLLITNDLTSPFTLAFKLDFLKLPPIASPITLPSGGSGGFTYTGPSNLSVVDVGPGQTFPEPAYAMPYVAPGFTMNIHAGSYFVPFAIPTGMDGFTIQAASGVTADQIIFNGRGGWVTGFPLWTGNDPAGSGPVNPYRLKFGKAFIYTNSPGTIRKIGFWYCGGGYGKSIVDTTGIGTDYPNAEQNIGDGEAGIYAEGFASVGTLVVDRCTFDGNENGIFVPKTNGANVHLQLQYCDFSSQVPNGMSPDGLSHNVYINASVITVDHCGFWDCNGNSFKSRSPNVTITNSMFMQGLGRAIDFPEGGSLTVSNCTFVQKNWGGATRIHNFIGAANENTANGAAIATFTNCTVHIAYDAAFLTHGGSSLTWTGTTYNWYNDGHNEAGFSYDTAFASETTSVSGLTFSPPGGTTFISGYPPRSTTLFHTQ